MKLATTPLPSHPSRIRTKQFPSELAFATKISFVNDTVCKLPEMMRYLADGWVVQVVHLKNGVPTRLLMAHRGRKASLAYAKGQGAIVRFRAFEGSSRSKFAVNEGGWVECVRTAIWVVWEAQIER